MNFKAIANAVTSKIGRKALVLQKNSPNLMFAAGVVGFGATVVLACKATMKLETILDEHHLKNRQIEAALVEKAGMYDENDARRDKAIMYSRTIVSMTRLYAPAIIVGAGAVAALTGSHVVLNRRNVGLTAAYAAIEKGFNEYRKRVTDELGPDADKQFRYGLIDKDVVEEDEHGTVVTTIKGLPGKNVSMYARFFDKVNSPSWSPQPNYNQLFLRCQQTYANDLLKSRGHVFLNEVYDMLGMSRTPAGAVVGWVYGKGGDKNGDEYIDFGIFEGDRYQGMLFVNGDERSILLDFNVDGVIYDKI